VFVKTQIRPDFVNVNVKVCHETFISAYEKRVITVDDEEKIIQNCGMNITFPLNFHGTCLSLYFNAKSARS